MTNKAKKMINECLLFSQKDIRYIEHYSTVLLFKFKA